MVTEDALSINKNIEQQFKNGDVGIEDYNRATSFYNTERIKELTAKSELEISEINLEELLGVKLEDVH
jgi:outer membrane protein TolC